MERRYLCFLVILIGIGSWNLFSGAATKLEGDDYLTWTSSTIDSITRKFRVNGQVGGSFDFRIKSTDRSYNYKLRATWLIPEMVRASARYWQLRERLTDEQTRGLVKEADDVRDTVVMVELDPREGSGVIPSNWLAVLRAKGSSVEAKGTVSAALRSTKALTSTVERDYAYDVFWVVFPLLDEKGQMILPDSASEADLIVSIYNKQGKVTWPIPESIRKKIRTITRAQ
jgi:hypothetical protein